MKFISTILCFALLTGLTIACKKQSAMSPLSNLPEVDSAAIVNAYPFVTASSSISLNTGSEYRVGLAQYASFFTFDRSVNNGDLYYEAIRESARQFKPLRFYILNDGTGKIVAVATPTQAEVEIFEKAWQ